MAAMLGDGMPLEQWFFEMPVVTRVWTTATVLTGLLVQCQILTPFQLFYSFRAVFHKQQVHTTTPRAGCTMGTATGTDRQTLTGPQQQYWRLLSTFVYFGPLSLNLLFHIFFIQRYARMLEESAASVAHFSWLMAYAAPWLPWVLIAFNVVLHGHWPKDELCGIAVGHVWYFFNDIYPSTHGGHRPMDPPQWWIRLFERGALAVPAPDSDIHAAALNRDVAAPVVPDVR
ncbi:hypothetical protein LTR48_005521 [Friedmanniomyces endolithicus]|uniref:Derlin n=1 Tax=Rachicladosporium monterosium TaxID=1507873 RepID=A0ABR0L2A0_9PEZI|nr:hypothetical protein LTR48_005521 [Friedmanniomyces endolithicus]KAK5142390.1 hypothetical protein LTR32_005255 [Rachicladosporium monterosium]